MKVAYFGGDWFLNCLEVWQLNGHHISHIFCHGKQSYNTQLRTFAKNQGIELSDQQPQQSDMQHLLNSSVDCLFCIEYPWLIPTDNLPFKTINAHPSLLPEGRGPTPMSWTLLKYPQFAGISFHKMTAKFDQGDIVYQTAIDLSPHETLDTYLAKLELIIPQALNTLLKDFDYYYGNSHPQSKGSYWRRISLNDRKISWSSKCSEIRHQVAAAGQFGVVVAVASELFLVTNLQSSEMTHDLPPGTLFQQDQQQMAISCADGICVFRHSNIIERRPIKTDQTSL